MLITALWLTYITATAQGDRPFKRTIYCDEYDIYIVMNFYEKDITIEGQEYMGAVDGYLGDRQDFRKWLILDAELSSDTSATFNMINSDGSEDLIATLTCTADSTYTLRQGAGSTLKIARKQKWLKLPKNITFTTTKQKK